MENTSPLARDHGCSLLPNALSLQTLGNACESGAGQGSLRAPNKRLISIVELIYLIWRRPDTSGFTSVKGQIIEPQLTVADYLDIKTQVKRLRKIRELLAKNPVRPPSQMA